MGERKAPGGLEIRQLTKRSLKKEEKISCLVQRINEAVRTGFTGTIRFEVNFTQGGIRTIKSSVEDLVKF